MRRILLSVALLSSLAGSARGDEVQAARERARTLLDRTIALSRSAAAALKPGQRRAEIFEALLGLDRRDGSSIGVYDADSRRVAWVGAPTDPSRLPEVDPSVPTRLVAATRSRAALIVTAKGPAPWFVLVSTPLLETRRDAANRMEVVDVLDPTRKLGLDYSDRSEAPAGDHASESISAQGVTFARLSPHSPEAHPEAPPGRIPMVQVFLLVLFGVGFVTMVRFARSGFGTVRPFLLSFLCLLSALSVTALLAEFAARRAERDEARREIESVLRAHLAP